MFAEDQLLPISALQHLLFCERQCALIHVEQVWVENRLTVEGRHLHDKAHGKGIGPRGGGRDELRHVATDESIRVVRALQLQSLHIGLYGVADVVEFHLANDDSPLPPASITAERDHSSQIGRNRDSTTGLSGVPFPVEYKRGKPKKDHSDRVQLCAQALCLEEMLGCIVPAGALFYGRTRRRLDVIFDGELRGIAQQAAIRLHELVASGRTPIARREPKCDNCSLINICMPDALASKHAASRYLQTQLRLAANDGHG